MKQIKGSENHLRYKQYNQKSIYNELLGLSVNGHISYLY